MAFHQWLNSTSRPQPTPAYVVDANNSISGLSPPAVQHPYPATNRASDIVLLNACDPSLDGFANFQAANGTSEAQMDRGAYGTPPGLLHTSHEELQTHPTMRLSHLEYIEQAAKVNLHTQRRPGNDSMRKYHAIMQQSTGIHWNKQMSKTFAPTHVQSRDRSAGGRPSLAATHPANYGTPARRPDHSNLATTPSTSYASGGRETTPTLMHSTLDTFEEFLDQMQLTSPLSSTSLPNPILPGSSPFEVPWRVYSDPMHQTSFSPDFPEPYCCILRSDRRLEPGNVVSPTYMIALPFGGMVEMAHHYPSKETLEATLKGDTGMEESLCSSF